jgi:sugar-specific transcriptional regulator TrmB
MSYVNKNPTNLLSILISFAIFSSVIVFVLWFYDYIANIPKPIESFTYSNNILEFKIKDNNDNLYKLKLPAFAKISSTDKLSINLHESYISGVSNNVKSTGFPRMVDKKIDLYINDKLTYNANNKLDLTYTFKDPATGLVVEKEFK